VVEYLVDLRLSSSVFCHLTKFRTYNSLITFRNDILFNFATSSSHEWTTLFPSTDSKYNIWKYILMKGNGKVHPRTGHEGHLFARWGWVVKRPVRFNPWKIPVSIVEEAAWALGSVWRVAENLTPYRVSIPGPSSP
jgi:hypothetical protein